MSRLGELFSLLTEGEKTLCVGFTRQENSGISRINELKIPSAGRSFLFDEVNLYLLM